MSERSKDKISLDGGDALQANPFAALSSEGLSDKSVPPETLPKTKIHKPKSKGRVEVRREKAGRGGKTVTTLKEFPSNTPLKELETLTFELKKSCACGGTLKSRSIELQGDVVEKVLKELENRNFQPVRAGG